MNANNAAATATTDKVPDFIDFFLGHNNGVVAMWPNPDGRFAALVRPVKDGREHQCWVFSTPSICEGRVVKTNLRAFHGNWTQLDELKSWMKPRSISWSSSGCAGTGFVPFSNGRRKYIRPEKEGGEWSSDYEDCEYACRYPSDPRMTIEAQLDVLNGVTER
ncbi:MAG: hypothetical protein ABIJ46_02815 [bacterium]